MQFIFALIVADYNRAEGFLLSLTITKREVKTER